MHVCYSDSSCVIFVYMAPRADSDFCRWRQEHGLADADGDAVALKCDRRLEALAFPDVHPHFAAVGEFARMCHAVPIHLVWASRGEIVYVRSWSTASSSLFYLRPTDTRRRMQP